MNLVRGDSVLGARVNRQGSSGLNQLLEQPHGEPPFGKGPSIKPLSVLLSPPFRISPLRKKKPRLGGRGYRLHR